MAYHLQVNSLQSIIQNNKIHHVKSSPYHPATNVLAKRAVQCSKKTWTNIFWLFENLDCKVSSMELYHSTHHHWYHSSKKKFHDLNCTYWNENCQQECRWNNSRREGIMIFMLNFGVCSWRFSVCAWYSSWREIVIWNCVWNHQSNILPCNFIGWTWHSSSCGSCTCLQIFHCWFKSWWWCNRKSCNHNVTIQPILNLHLNQMQEPPQQM